jgi:hypothetical protein
VVAGLTLLALLVFALALAMKRRAGSAELRRYARSAAVVGGRYLSERNATRGRVARSTRDVAVSAALDTIARRLDDYRDTARGDDE